MFSGNANREILKIPLSPSDLHCSKYKAKQMSKLTAYKFNYSLKTIQNRHFIKHMKTFLTGTAPLQQEKLRSDLLFLLMQAGKIINLTAESLKFLYCLTQVRRRKIWLAVPLPLHHSQRSFPFHSDKKHLIISPENDAKLSPGYLATKAN
ncbi:hypothetical protein T10_12944 [Trichinella papuae]|uniref:Uncharacterized protein n=1 Tax=Trichinella papuae TaxID=268474 RepID=A0A0V1N3V3_9BILA|nr:hypothetical protein T10_12944 [Trichinella papuae]